MHKIVRSERGAAFAAAFLLVVSFGSVQAAPLSRFRDAEILRIVEARQGEPLTLREVMLPSGPADLEIEEFDVFAPGAVLEAIGENGEVTPIPRPAIRYFRGGIAGVRESLIFLAIGSETGGFLVSGDRKYRIFSAPRTRAGRGPALEPDVLIEDVSIAEEMPFGAEVWACEVDDFPLTPAAAAAAPIAAAIQHVTADSLTSSTAMYVLNIAVEGDFELYQRQGSNSSATANYLSNLVAAVSTIYQRDLRTEVRIAYSGHHTAVGDPFTMDPATNGAHSTFDALVEFGKRWHNTPPSAAARSAAMLVSGKDYGAGIAWTDWICQGDFAFSTTNVANGFGGAYGVFMDAGGATNFDPDGNPDYQADLDRFGFEYWPVMAFAHEFGHTVQSSHTHCVPLTAQEKIDYGVTRNFVDECYSGEVIPTDPPFPCYSNGGGGAVNANLPPELGTIMSYCHLTTGDPLGFGAATRFTFGQPGQTGIKIVNNMVAEINAKAPSLAAAITAPASVSSGVAANASIPLGASLTYAWTIQNGVINSGASGSTGAGGTFVVNFTGSADPVTLKVTVTNASGCSATDYVEIPLSSALAAPTSVVAYAASATSVNVTWAGSVGATGYQIHRSTNGATFVQVGTDTDSPFVDATASANTAYFYKVRATNGGSTSDFSNRDLATTVIFTDPDLAAGYAIDAAHFTQLRTAVNAIHVMAALGTITFADASLPGIPVEALHLTELRTHLDMARLALSLSSLTYTDGTPAGVPIKAVHITELRAGVE